MCLILFGINEHPDYPLVVAANRDEDLRRPTAPMAHWRDSLVLAGRDMVAGGTWLGVSGTGRVVCVTNVREPGSHRAEAESRGRMVVGLLESTAPLEDEMKQIRGADYNGFNLVVFEDGKALYRTNRGDESVQVIRSGFHGLSNARMDTAWPKVTEGVISLRGSVASLGAGALEVDPFFALLANSQVAPDERLPDTGVGVEIERLLSPAFIRASGYGTRSSTVILIGPEGGLVVERTHPPGGGPEENRSFVLTPEQTGVWPVASTPVLVSATKGL